MGSPKDVFWDLYFSYLLKFIKEINNLPIKENLISIDNWTYYVHRHFLQALSENIHIYITLQEKRSQIKTLSRHRFSAVIWGDYSIIYPISDIIYNI